MKVKYLKICLLWYFDCLQLDRETEVADYLFLFGCGSFHYFIIFHNRQDDKLYDAEECGQRNGEVYTNGLIEYFINGMDKKT